MTITAEGTTLTDEIRTAMESGITAMGSPTLRVRVTNQFTDTVRRLSGLRQYSTNRGAGMVAAKTIGSTVVVNAEALKELDARGVERLLAHEAGHVLLNNRGETFAGFQQLSGNAWRWHVMATAGIGMEEFRIERHLAAAGYPSHYHTDMEHWDNALFQMNADVVETALTASSADLLVDGVMTALTRIVTTMAYTAGALIDSGATFDTEKLPISAQENWSEYLSGTWNSRLNLYRTLPGCGETLPRAHWIQALLDGVDIEQDTLSDFGFAFEDGPDDDNFAFWRTGNDALFNRRVQRAISEGLEE